MTDDRLGCVSQVWEVRPNLARIRPDFPWAFWDVNWRWIQRGAISHPSRRRFFYRPDSARCQDRLERTTWWDAFPGYFFVLIDATALRRCTGYRPILVSNWTAVLLMDYSSCCVSEPGWRLQSSFAPNRVNSFVWCGSCVYVGRWNWSDELIFFFFRGGQF